jgi:hypothetical protein
MTDFARPTLLAIASAFAVWACVGSVAGEEMVQPRRLVDAPTAGVLPKAAFDFDARIYPTGNPDMPGAGLQMGVSVGVLDRLNIGVSYGADGLVGRGRNIRPNPYPGAYIKYRIFEEDYFIPGIALGYDHQGYGGIENNDYDGFVYKSPGFFLALSKNYLVFSKMQIGIHGAVNFSLEELRYVRWPNAYVGVDLGINEELAVVAEYDLALNAKDPLGTYLNPLRGYINAGIRWSLTKSFAMEFDAKDLMENKVSAGRRLGWSREFKFVYMDHF